MKQDYLMEGIRAIDLALFIEKPGCLAISDLQLGYEEMMNKQGVLVPRFNFAEIKKRLETKILSKVKPKTIVINGDLKQEFGRISEQEWQETLGILGLLKKHCREIVVVKGNHDVFLGPIAKWENLEIVQEFFLEKEKILFTHGHKASKTPQLEKADTIIVGHEHPAVKIRDAAKTETFKCFLKGTWKRKTIIVQPSLNAIAIGTDIMSGQTHSPFLKKNLSEFEVWITEDKTYYFGKVKEIVSKTTN